MGYRHDLHGFRPQLLWPPSHSMVPRTRRSRIVCPIDSVLTVRFPGVQFYLSCWYKRKEFGVRSAIFFSAAALSGSFGGLLAAAIANMNGLGGKAGWAWIVPPCLNALISVHLGGDLYRDYWRGFVFRHR